MNNIQLIRKLFGKDCLELETSKDFTELSVIEIRNIIFKYCEKKISDEKMV